MGANSLGILEGPNMTVTATAVAIEAHARVAYGAAGTVSVAGIAVTGIGNVKSAIAASGRGLVRLHNAPGTHFGVASEAIAVGDIVYCAAAGRYSKTAGGGAYAMGYALTAASGAGVVFTYVKVPGYFAPLV